MLITLVATKNGPHSNGLRMCSRILAAIFLSCWLEKVLQEIVFKGSFYSGVGGYPMEGSYMWYGTRFLFVTHQVSI
jgi:hypothetical protein